MKRRLILPLTIFGLVTASGTAGYMLIERWSLFDSLYMTVITVATVGFGETHPLSFWGRLFTMFLILAGVSALGFALAQLIDILLQGHLSGLLEELRMKKRIAELRGHTIVAGFGRVGSVVAQTLADEGAFFVVVDASEHSCEEARQAGWLYVCGDATEEDVLEAAGIALAGSVVTALSGDAENLFVTVTARALNSGLFIVSRSSHASTEAKLYKGGADRAITPNVIGGRRMASMILQPAVSDYLDIVSAGNGVEFRLQELELVPGSCFIGTTLGASRIRELTGAQVVAVIDVDASVNVNPSVDSMLEVGQRLVILGTVEAVAALAEQACVLGVSPSR